MALRISSIHWFRVRRTWAQLCLHSVVWKTFDLGRRRDIMEGIGQLEPFEFRRFQSLLQSRLLALRGHSKVARNQNNVSAYVIVHHGSPQLIFCEATLAPADPYVVST